MSGEPTDDRIPELLREHRMEGMTPEFRERLLAAMDRRVRERAGRKLPSPGRWRITAQIAAAAALLVALALLMWFPRPAPGPIEEVQGKVTVEGNRVRSAPGETAVLRLRDRTRIRVGESSELHIDDFREDGPVRLRLTEGSVGLSLSDRTAPLEIDTPPARLTARSGAFALELEFRNAQGEKVMKKQWSAGLAVALLTVVVTEGSVVVSNSYGSEELRSGGRAVVREGTAPVQQEDELRACRDCAEKWSKEQIEHALESHLECAGCSRTASDDDLHGKPFPSARYCDDCAGKTGMCVVCGQDRSGRKEAGKKAKPVCDGCVKSWTKSEIDHAREAHLNCTDCLKSVEAFDSHAGEFPRARYCDDCAGKAGRCVICGEIQDKEAKKAMEGPACAPCSGKWSEEQIAHAVQKHLVCGTCGRKAVAEDLHGKPYPTARFCLDCARKAGTCVLCGEDLKEQAKKVEEALDKLARSHSGKKDDLILWIKQTPGFVPANRRRLIRHYREYPRFGLYGDGTVIYRNDQLEYRRVKLDGEEMTRLLKSVLRLDLHVLTEDLIWEGETVRMGVADAGSEIIGVKLKTASSEIDLGGPVAIFARNYPKNERLQNLKKIRDLLWDYAHKDAEEYDPEKEK